MPDLTLTQAHRAAPRDGPNHYEGIYMPEYERRAFLTRVCLFQHE